MEQGEFKSESEADKVDAAYEWWREMRSDGAVWKIIHEGKIIDQHEDQKEAQMLLRKYQRELGYCQLRFE